MIIANKPLNYQALALEEAEALIRETIRNSYIDNTPLSITQQKVAKIIKTALKHITIPSLMISARKSLINFYRRQQREISRIPRQKVLVSAFFFAKLSGGKPTQEQKKAINLAGIEIDGGKVNVPSAKIYGVPMQQYSDTYFREQVKPVYDRLEEQFPLDPNDISGKNSLRNLAEMEVRYQGHIDQIEDLKAQGHKLVIASTHADCSDRCAPYQGRVFSLDGTSGTTDDGRKFVPLEEATDVWYTTKAGKRYKNGLLGFNCRHFLVPYKKGYRFPKPNVEEERKQYAITLKQRALEREVRKWKTKALTLKGTDRKGYLEAKKKATEWNKRYIEFSQKNERAYYPSRTKII